MDKVNSILAIDVGKARIGLAIANNVARLPRPLGVQQNNNKIYHKINTIVDDNQVETIVVGLPRNMSGEETKQSQFSREFAAKLEAVTDKAVVFADESLSSKRAETSSYSKDPSGHDDSIAACFILEEYLEIHS